MITSQHSTVDRAVDTAVDAHSADMIAFLQSLVRLSSVSGTEQHAQQAIADRYRALGIETDVVTSVRADLEQHPAFSDDGIPFTDRINVVGRWRGTGEGRSLILNGHMDVVPAGDLTQWQYDPWGGEIVGNRLYGRGSCDMKAGLVAAVFAVQALQAIEFMPGGDVLLESVIGEESGGIGTLTTIVHGYTADGCVIMEPTELDLCPVQSGALTFRITVTGRSAHACMKPSGVSAIEEFAPILAMLQRLNAERHAQFSNPLFEDPSNVAPISVGTVHAGDWHSTVPNLLVAEGRFGVFPGESVDAARAVLVEALDTESRQHPWLAEHPPTLEWFEGQFESGQTPVDAPIVQTVGAEHRMVTGATPIARGVTFGADLRLFTRHAGIPTVMYGPGSVSIAHTADEFVPIDQVITCAKVLARTIVGWCADSSAAVRR
jgi:acetylornithine deacetylase